MQVASALHTVECLRFFGTNRQPLYFSKPIVSVGLIKNLQPCPVPEEGDFQQAKKM